jgi:transcriptional regulator with XRE-family HTH domain
MTLREMILAIHFRLKSECFVDLVEETGLAPSTIWKWRNEPPLLPSLKVFIKLAQFCGYNPTVDQLEPLL